MGAGQPKKFQSPEELEQLFFEYIDHCDKKALLPNIAGFCTFLKRIKKIPIHRDTYYAYKNEYEEFSDIIKSIDDALEDAVLNNKNQKELIRMAYLNSKCGYAQKIDIQTNIKTTSESITPEAADQILKDALNRAKT